MAKNAFGQVLDLLGSLNRDEQLQLISILGERLRGNPVDFVEDIEEEEPDETGKPRKFPMPRIAKMLEWGVLEIGDRLIIKEREDEAAMLLDKNYVAHDGHRVRINDWAKAITGWSAVNIYAEVRVERAGRYLWEIRKEAMLQRGMEYRE